MLTFYCVLDLLTTPPGSSESVLFENDGSTLLKSGSTSEQKLLDKEEIDKLVKINLEEVVDNNVHLVGEVLLSFN